MKMKITEYIEQEEFELQSLKDRLKEIQDKWIKFGLKAEEEFLKKYIELKKKLIKDLRKNDKVDI